MGLDRRSDDRTRSPRAAFAPPRGRSGAFRPSWPGLVRRGTQAGCITSGGLAAGLGYRYAAAHPSLDPGATGGELAALLLALLAFVLCSAVVVFRPERGEVRRLAWTSAVWSVALLLALAGIWYLTDAGVRDDPEIGTPVRGPTDVEAVLAASAREAPGGGAAPLAIPTGVLIQSIEFVSANDVQVSGFVWQRYADSVPAAVTRGFVLPESPGQAYQADEAYRYEENGAEVIGWRVDATLRQGFDYRRYPFDRQDVRLRFWPQDPGGGVILVPDFAAYASTDPAALPGLEEQLVYGDWNPEYASFSYARTPATTTLGVGIVPQRGTPELYFNIGLKRDFTGPFFDHVQLALAVALLLFVLLCLTTSDADLQQRFGLGPTAVVGTASGLLFAVILKQGQIRTAVPSRQLVYLETLPLVLYVGILLVAANAILLAGPVNVRLVEYGKNVLPVLLYWPLLLGLVLAVTLLTFSG